MINVLMVNYQVSQGNYYENYSIGYGGRISFSFTKGYTWWLFPPH